jgi:hypothetical protein
VGAEEAGGAGPAWEREREQGRERAPVQERARARVQERELVPGLGLVPGLVLVRGPVQEEEGAAGRCRRVARFARPVSS